MPKKSDADNLSTLFDANVTRGALKNLVTDKPAPITTALAQVKKSDADNLSTLFDANVTRGALKNLVTDKPAPITTALAQVKKSDADNLSTLFDANVTRGALKNLVTDKPAPITTALAQTKKSDADNLSTLFDANVTRGALKNLVTDKPAPITTALAQKSKPLVKNLLQLEKSDKDGLFTALGQKSAQQKVFKKVGSKCFNKDDKEIDCNLHEHNVTIGALKNLINDTPAPITKPLAAAQKNGVPVLVNPVIAKNEMGDKDLALELKVGP